MSPEAKFYPNEQHDLDSIFPPAKILEYEEDGASDWVDFFQPLEEFGAFPTVLKKAQKKVIKLFLNEEKYGSKIRTKKTPEGTMVYKRNIAPLLYAALSINVFGMSFGSVTPEGKVEPGYFTQDFYNSVNKVTSTRTSNPAQDWKR